MNIFTQTTGNKSVDENPDVVLIHGWGMNGDVWEGILPALTKKHRVTIIDLPGHGRSLETPHDYTLPKLAALLANVLPEKSILVGWSLGGMIATQFTLDYPQRVNRLALVASAPQFVKGNDWPDGTDKDVLDGFADDLKQNYPQTINRFIAIQAMGSDFAREEKRTLRERVFRHGNPQPAALEGGLDILRRENLRPRLSEINCPCLLIAGEHDALFRRAAAQKTQTLFKHADLNIIKGAGHAPFLSHPDVFLHSLLPFISHSK
ncbi:MAG: pimeloyl-ACP methyl ester esterase BioH [Ectothiorhodospiraceae bacterium]|nr:pimeloyl-ACP methyl ester esterase BioH [Ectothiorhodospiraceae bacterium]